LQAATLKRYDAPLSLTTLICFVGTLQAIVVTFAMEHSMSVWKIGFDMNLLAAAYAVSLENHLTHPLPHRSGGIKHGVTLTKNRSVRAGYRDIEHCLLRARAGDAEQGARVRLGVQPAHDDHRRHHGVVHPR
jgi:hypothetical protein